MTPRDPADKVGGRTALVTGAGNGLGRAIAISLASRGARVLLVGRDTRKLAAVRDEIGDKARIGVCDTSSPGAVDGLAASFADEDVSILVNNAGVAGPVAPLTDISPSEWDDVFAVNVRGVYLMCRAFLPPMIANGSGDIINLASVSGKRPLARRTPYAASKMAVIGLTATLAHEIGPLGVTVNTLSPGPVSGPRMERNFKLDAERLGITAAESEKEFVSRAALKRMVTEDEVASAVVAILHMPGMCGADIDLSAGMIARLFDRQAVSFPPSRDGGPSTPARRDSVAAPGACGSRAGGRPAAMRPRYRDELRDELAVILAGDGEPLRKLLYAAPPLAARFSAVIEFPVSARKFRSPDQDQDRHLERTVARPIPIPSFPTAG